MTKGQQAKTVVYFQNRITNETMKSHLEHAVGLSILFIQPRLCNAVYKYVFPSKLKYCIFIRYIFIHAKNHLYRIKYTLPLTPSIILPTSPLVLPNEQSTQPFYQTQLFTSSFFAEMCDTENSSLNQMAICKLYLANWNMNHNRIDNIDTSY